MDRKYGWIRQLPDKRDFKFAYRAAVEPVPVDLRSLCAPVRDQGQAGACSGFMARGALMFERNRQKLTGVDDVSPQFIYWCERVSQGTQTIDSGSTIREAYKIINTEGACLESDCPYDLPAQIAVAPSAAAFANAATDKTVKYEAVAQNLDAIRTVLQSGFAFGFGFAVYQSFESSKVAATGVVPMPNITTEKCLGGHAVLCVGDQPDQSRFIVQNSWSTAWGDKGFFYFPYSYMLDSDLVSDLWAVQLV